MLVIKTSLYYDAQSKKHQPIDFVFRQIHCEGTD
jgi:hypothetical protein